MGQGSQNELEAWVKLTSRMCDRLSDEPGLKALVHVLRTVLDMCFLLE